MDTITKSGEKIAKAKRPRSPNYPFYSIGACVDLLKKFVKNNKGFSKAHMDYAKEHMGFTAKSTRGNRAISSMLGYGLFNSEGSGDNRSFWPSDLAKKIFQDNDNLHTIQEATLNDTETMAIYDEFGEALPGQGSLERWLMTERSYSEEGAKRFAYIVQENYGYAKLDRSEAYVEPGSKNEDDSISEDNVTPGAASTKSNQPSPGMVDYPIPLDGGKRFVYLRAPGDLSEADFDYIVQVINVLKIGLSKKG